MLSDIGRYLPEYLSPENKRDLVKGLRDFPENFQYYLNRKFEDDALQGDLWCNLTVIDFESGDRRNVKGIVLSNSCDIDELNNRVLPISITFVPLIDLKKLIKLLHTRRSPEQVENIVTDIKNQTSTSFLYIPAGHGVEKDFVAYLSDIHAIPLSTFKKQASKMTTLSQQGFYMFLLKLSIHFCRFQEGVIRS